MYCKLITPGRQGALSWMEQGGEGREVVLSRGPTNLSAAAAAVTFLPAQIMTNTEEPFWQQ